MSSGASGNGAQATSSLASAQEEPDEVCLLCDSNLPDVGRGIVTCGHVFCFACIIARCKTDTACPQCRDIVQDITKTLTEEEVKKEQDRKERHLVTIRHLVEMKKSPQEKSEAARLRRSKAARLKRKTNRLQCPMEGVFTKMFRVHEKKQKKSSTVALGQQVPAPHPQRMCMNSCFDLLKVEHAARSMSTRRNRAPTRYCKAIKTVAQPSFCDSGIVPASSAAQRDTHNASSIINAEERGSQSTVVWKILGFR
ncbi:unnamed protein product [Pylaiella littoralis]